MQNFNFLFTNNTCPEFNLAVEEYLLTNSTQNFILLWQNAPAVIIGANQNALAEVNLSACNNNGVKVIRRITGGGAVYHDLGNICYSVITNDGDNNGENAFSRFTRPVIEFLNSLGVNAQLSGRNDIIANGYKISGNAKVTKKNRTLVHGTLLFDSNLEALSAYLTPAKIKLESKGVKSVKGRVTNIKGLISQNFTTAQFFSALGAHLMAQCSEYALTSIDLDGVNTLIKEKYSNYAWNIGQSPKGQLSLTERFSFGTLTLCFSLNSGVIESAKIYGDFFALKSVKDIENALNGKRLIKSHLLSAFKGVENYIEGANASQIVNKLIYASQV